MVTPIDCLSKKTPSAQASSAVGLSISYDCNRHCNGRKYLLIVQFIVYMYSLKVLCWSYYLEYLLCSIHSFSVYLMRVVQCNRHCNGLSGANYISKFHILRQLSFADVLTTFQSLYSQLSTRRPFLFCHVAFGTRETDELCEDSFDRLS